MLHDLVAKWSADLEHQELLQANAYLDQRGRPLDPGDRDVPDAAGQVLSAEGRAVRPTQELLVAVQYFEWLRRAQAGDAQAEGIRNLVRASHVRRPATARLAHVEQELLTELTEALPTTRALQSLPPYSWLLRLKIKLATAYLGKDDRLFSVMDNPVCKDWVLHAAYLRSTTWKGRFRSAASEISQGLFGAARDAFVEAINQLFGPDEVTEEGGGWLGRLRFYPSFFEKWSYDVITPHDRDAKVPRPGPIFFECVPAGEETWFTLLYVPFDLLGRPEAEARTVVRADWQVMRQLLRAVLVDYGFSAKSTLGYGSAEERFSSGWLALRGYRPVQLAADEPPPEPPPQPATQLDFLTAEGRLKLAYAKEDGSPQFPEWYGPHRNWTPKQRKKSGVSRTEMERWEEIDKWWQQSQTATDTTPPEAEATAAIESTPSPETVQNIPVGSIDDFEALAVQIVSALESEVEQ